MFFCEFCEIFKNISFYRTPLVAATVYEKNYLRITTMSLTYYLKQNFAMIHKYTLSEHKPVQSQRKDFSIKSDGKCMLLVWN